MKFFNEKTVWFIVFLIKERFRQLNWVKKSCDHNNYDITVLDLSVRDIHQCLKFERILKNAKICAHLKPGRKISKNHKKSANKVLNWQIRDNLW